MRATAELPSRTECRPQPYLAVLCPVDDDVGEALSWGYRVLYRWLGDRRIVPSGPPFVRVVEAGRDGRPLELEAAVPVAVEVFADGLVHSGVIARDP